MGQHGNVWEWNESADDGINSVPTERRTLRGGDWRGAEDSMRPSTRSGDTPYYSVDVTGFRVASVVPEPSSLALLAVAAVGLATRRNRKLL
jgi:formylglycine-generating enzyme required for sulfatase activity